MTDRELDALVAEKVFGITLQHSKYHRIYGIPNYSTDIAAAWEVVEKMGFALAPFNDLGWVVCKGQQREDYNLKPQFVHAHYVAHAETAPRAICLAALKIVEVNLPVGR